VVFCTAENRKKMAGAKSEKEARLNYTVQPFAREYFDVMSSVQLFAANDSHVSFYIKPLRKSDKLSAIYYEFDPS